jgi:type IV pilus assembly protein PilB
VDEAGAAGAVLIYGWGATAAAGLMRVLGEAGLPASVASTEEVLAADERMVVLAPLPSLEALEQRPRAQLLVAGKVPERDVLRAQALKARGFLAAPLDADLMLRAVRRLLRAAEEAPRLREVG